MRIAQVSPLYESVPPTYYGGTERVVSYLTEELVRQGHEVTLFASGDSVTAARLVAACPASLRLETGCIDMLAHHVTMLEQVVAQAARFDLIHFHIDYLHYPISRRYHTPHLTSLHGRLDIADLIPLYRTFPEVPVVSISDAQRAPLPWLNWQATIHHGLPLDLYSFQEGPGSYLVFLGRISQEKRVDRAIEIAKRVGTPLKIAAKIDRMDHEYFCQQVEPLLRDPCVEYLGEVGDAEKGRLLARAQALLFPIDWPEPFGLAMIEAMACGTPVIAWRKGSVPEIIEQGVSGFVVNDMEEAVAAVRQIRGLSRRRCREAFEARFSAQRMARDYVAVYEHLIERGRAVETIRQPAMTASSAI